MDFFFIQMSDPQFGMFARLSSLDEDRIAELHRSRGWNIIPTAKTVGFAQETALYEKAIEAANRLNPAFVVISGDMVEDQNDPNQLAELRRITAKLHPHIPAHWVPGNWDVGITPTPHTALIITPSSMAGPASSSSTVAWATTTPGLPASGTDRSTFSVHLWFRPTITIAPTSSYFSTTHCTVMTLVKKTVGRSFP